MRHPYPTAARVRVVTQSITRQQGVALIIVLLVLAIATVAVTGMSYNRQLDIRRTENLLRTTEANELIFSLESWAAEKLRTDLSVNSSDSSADDWVQALPKTTLPGGVMTAQLTDLQGRFNLNNLLVDDQPNPVDVQRFKRLLNLLGINPGITDAILDWLDADSIIRYPNGAEDETYLDLPTPYRSANRKFADTSELLLIHGLSLTDYKQLQAYVFVADTYEPLNVNTADPLLLRTLADDLTDKQAELLTRTHHREAFKQIAEFLQHPALAAFSIDKHGLSVTSRNFLLTMDIKLGKLNLTVASHLLREDNGNVRILNRQRKGLDNG